MSRFPSVQVIPWNVSSATTLSFDLQSCISNCLLDIVPRSPQTQIINLHHMSATSSIFLVLASDPNILSGTRLQTCGLIFFTHPSYPVSHQVWLDFFSSKSCSLTTSLCFPTAPIQIRSEHLMPGISSTAS